VDDSSADIVEAMMSARVDGDAGVLTGSLEALGQLPAVANQMFPESVPVRVGLRSFNAGAHPASITTTALYASQRFMVIGGLR
jgi:hypothetical protein